VARLAHVWNTLALERRLAFGAAAGMFLTLFLPWYRVTVVQVDNGHTSHYRLPSTQVFSGWGAFSFVEAAVLIVAVAVMVLLFLRAEGKAFHLPGGDGTVILLAGAWISFLVIWRMFDKSGLSGAGQVALSTGIEWGIFVSLLMAALLTYTGIQVRRAHIPEPPLATEGGAVFDGRWHTPGEVPALQVQDARKSRAAARAAERMARRRPAAAAAAAAAEAEAEPPTAVSAPAQPPPTTAAAQRSADVAQRPAGAPTYQTVDTPDASVRDQRPRPSRSNWRPGDSPEWSDEDPAAAPRWLAAAEELQDHPLSPPATRPVDAAAEATEPDERDSGRGETPDA